MMLFAILLGVVGVVAYVSISNKPEDGGGDPIDPSGWQPGKPIIVQNPNAAGFLPEWSIEGIFKNGKESRRWGRADLVWPNGERMEWKGDRTVEHLNMCDLAVEYFEGQSASPTEIKKDDIVVGECQPKSPIDFEAVFGVVLDDPMNQALPYAAFDGYKIEVLRRKQGNRMVSPIMFGIELRLAHMKGNPLTFISSAEEIRQDSTLRFQ